MNNFFDVAGHGRIVRSLKESIAGGMVSHAYIFYGNRGSGRKTTAKAFAKAANCLNPQNGEACGKCSSCQQLDSGNNPDIFYVKPLKTKSLGVDDIREQIVERVKIRPYSYEKKIFIVDNADAMTVQAQNALLKTLEEPPEYVVIVLIAQNLENFLPTVLSRCVIMKFNPLGIGEVKNYLVDRLKVKPEDADFFAEYSAGSIGEALRLSEDEDFYLMREDVIKALCAMDGKNTAEVMLMANDMEKYKGYEEFFDIMYMWYRDVLCYKFFNGGDRVIQKDKLEMIKSQAESLSFEALASRLKAVMDIKKRVKQNAAFQLSMEVLFINIKES